MVKKPFPTATFGFGVELGMLNCKHNVEHFSYIVGYGVKLIGHRHASRRVRKYVQYALYYSDTELRGFEPLRLGQVEKTLLQARWPILNTCVDYH